MSPHRERIGVLSRIAFCVACALTPLPLSAQAAFPVLAADAPAGAGQVSTCAPGVAGSARCGVLRVWEDRERRAGRTLDVAFIILDAADASAGLRDAVILLPGGPGETFTDAAAPLSRQWAQLRRRRDILLVDVRGVGRSHALDCDIPSPGGAGSRFGVLFPVDHAAACRDHLQQRADLSQYTTASTVDDLEELRQWLGYDRFNLIGGSYGTRVAQVYMRRHPGAVRTAVLNGVAPVAEPLYVQHARLLQRALDRVIADCTGDAACSSANPGLARRFASVRARLDEAPVEVSVGGERVRFSLGDLAYALRGMLYARGGDVPGLITRAAAGDVQPLADYYVQRTAWIANRGGSAGYHFSVLCAEDIAPLTDDAVARATRGTFMGAHMIDAYRRICELWPHARVPAAHWTPVRSDVPTLLLSGGRDPVTPPEGAAAVARHLSRARHVVIPTGGHGVGGPCVLSLIVHLVETGTLERLDTSCLPRARP